MIRNVRDLEYYVLQTSIKISKKKKISYRNGKKVLKNNKSSKKKLRSEVKKSWYTFYFF